MANSKYSTKTYIATFAVCAIITAAGIVAFTQLQEPTTNVTAIAGVTNTSADVAVDVPEGRKIVVYKSPTCGCCKNWITYLEDAGYEVEFHDEEDMAMVKAKYGVPGRAQSCHTGIIDGYVIEGHVPVADIERLLTEKLDVAGIATPGMPIGSPGMEVGDQKDPYDVVAFKTTGEVAVFASHNK